MVSTLERVLQRYPRPYITDTELDILIDGTPDSRYSKVKRLIAQGCLLRIRRGLYCITEEVGYTRKPHPYELSPFIYGPSYISLESALSFHQLIPEAVYTITCMTGKRSKDFQTPFGLYRYHHLPLENLFLEVELIQDSGYQFFMAKPWKAICDYLFCHEKNATPFESILEDLRINSEDLPTLGDETRYLLDEYYTERGHKMRFLS